MRFQTAALLHSDPVFPQRDLLLDPDYMGRRFGMMLGIHGELSIEDCERVRATYRPGQSLRVIYKFRADGEPCMIAARALADTLNRQQYQRGGPPASGNAAWRSSFWDDATEATCWIFPHDRKIAALPALMAVPDSLAELLESRWAESRLVAYASEKCATVQCLDAEQSIVAYGKVYAGSEGRACYELYNALAHRQGVSDAPYGVPRAILYSSSLQLLLLEPIAGQRIADLRGENLERGLHSLGQTLAAFHATPPPEGAPEFTRFHPERLRETADAIAMVRPDVAAMAHSLCDQLSSTAVVSDSPVCLHGDVHPKNGILCGDRIVLVDLDQVAFGPAAADLGSLLAGLRYDAVVGSLSQKNEQWLSEAFLSGYQALKRLPEPQELRWYTAAALLAERASRAVSRVRQQGLEHLQELLVAAQEMLGGNNG
jgi:Phosphotransferase enzyme family